MLDTSCRICKKQIKVDEDFFEQNMQDKMEKQGFQGFYKREKIEIFYIFFWGIECVGHFCLCRPFCIFEKCLDSNASILATLSLIEKLKS